MIMKLSHIDSLIVLLKKIPIKKIGRQLKLHWIQWAICCMFGMTVALTFFFYCIFPYEIGKHNIFFQVVIILFAFAVFTLLICFLLYHFAFPRLSVYSKTSKRILLLGSLLSGIYLFFVIPVPQPAIPQAGKLEITAMGLKNSKAVASELWVISIYVDGSQITPSDLKLQGDWEVREGIPLSYKNQPATLLWEGWVVKDLRLSLLNHPDSGIIKILWNNQEQTVDLYAASSFSKELILAANPFSVFFQGFIAVTGGVCIGILLFCCLAFLLSRSIKVTPLNSSKPWAFLGYTLTLSLGWFVFLFSYWPGIMTSDSTDQWHQMLIGKFEDMHPAFHTLTNWLITRIWLSPAAVAIAQIIAFSLVIAWGLSLLRKYGAPGWLPWFVIALLLISPANGLIVVTLWKDVPYTISLLALTILLFEIVMSRGNQVEKKSVWIPLGITMALATMYRHNGVIVGIGSIFFLMIVYRKHWKKIIAVCVLYLAIWWGVRGPLYQVIGVNTSAKNPGIAWVISQLIARHLNEGTPLLPDERALLAKSRSGEPIWPYNCDLNGVLTHNGQMKAAYVADHTLDLAYLALKLTRRNPQTTISHYLCNSAFIFQITQQPSSFYELINYGIDKNNMGIVSDSKLPSLQEQITAWSKTSQSLSWVWFFWRGPFWMYTFLFGMIILCLRSKSWEALLLFVPMALNAFPLAVLSTGQIFRYIYPTIIISNLFCWFLLFYGKIPDNNKVSTETGTICSPGEIG